MKIRYFLALTVLLALLICSAAFFSRPGGSVIVTHPGVGPTGWPGSSFITDDRFDRRIDCPIMYAPDIAAVWEREPARCSLETGWTPAQSWGSWATGPRSTLLFQLHKVTDRTLVVRACSNQDLPADRNQSLLVTVNGRPLPPQHVPLTWKSLQFQVPAAALRHGANEVVLEFAERISPSEAGTGNDFRTLAARVAEIALLDPTAEEGRGAGPHPAAATLDGAGDTVFLPGPGTLVHPVLIPADAAELELGLRASRSVDLDTLDLSVEVSDLDGQGQRREEVRFGPRSRNRTAVLDVRDIAGRWAVLRVETSHAFGQVEVFPVRFRAAARAEREPTPGALVAPTSTPPDIILITLDAARSDRFSFTGRRTGTTPFIDRLAADSLVFSNAFALAPYTLCSVPTILTGMSFLDHGVVAHEDVLSQDAVTLAEVLHDSGYRTACFSATPNNSKAKGFDQGYEVFREVWTEGPTKESRRAHYIAAKVVEWLESIDDDGRPLHLQVHMVPPHAPYDPDPPFDRFTNPDYDGPCNGFRATLAGLDGGSLDPTPECLEHVSNLYDGNLSVADDATRIIVEALSRRPRWNNTVVLVISDHGEAFFEHGRMDHNSTLFREMLQVPFVLRMPPGFDTGGIDTEGLVTLADVAPTLIAAAGIEAPPMPDGIDLLDAGRDRTGRALIARSADNRPILGIRTVSWNMSLEACGSGRLFDLDTDPDELRNLALEEPATFAGLGRILTWRVGLPARLVTAAETADITDEERALLETLGYIR
jgi:arylsulfatase A-like enzyme